MGLTAGFIYTICFQIKAQHPAKDHLIMRFYTTFILLLLITACSSLPNDLDVNNWSEQRFYEEGRKAMDGNNFETAAKHYEGLQSHYPFGVYAQQAHLDLIFTHYRLEEYSLALSTADRFIRLYPRHHYLNYVYYMRGIIQFSQISGAMDRILKLDTALRDPQYMKDALLYFNELTKRFPDGKYSADAKQHIVHLNNQLAHYEISIAEYYLKRSAFVAAVNRAKIVVHDYQNTPSISDALAIMSAAYQQLGLTKLSVDARKILDLNHPGYTGDARIKRLITEHK